MKKHKDDWHGCPIRYSAAIIADPWSFMLLRDILFKGKRYYGEFLASEEGISTNILADRLEKLECAQILTRHKDAIKRSKVYYLPTQKALELVPIFLQMIEWAERHDEKTEVPKQFIDAYRADPDQVLQDTLQSIETINQQLSGLQ